MEWSSRPEIHLDPSTEVKSQVEALKQKVGERAFDGPKLISLLLRSTLQNPVTSMDLDALESLIQSKRKTGSPSKTKETEKKKKIPAPSKISKVRETGDKSKKKTISEKTKAADSQTSSPKKNKTKGVPKRNVRNLETNTTSLDPIHEVNESFSTDHPQTGLTSGQDINPSSCPTVTPKRKMNKDKGIMVEDVPSAKRRKQTVSRDHIESMGVSQDSPPVSPLVPFGKKDWRLYDFLATLLNEKDSLRNPDLADYIARNLILDADLTNDNICGPLTSTPGRLISFLPDILELEAKRTTAVKQAKIARRKNEEDQQEFKETVFKLETRATTLSGDIEKLKLQIQNDTREHEEEVKELKSAITIANDKVKKAEELEKENRLQKEAVEKDLREEKDKSLSAQGEIENLKNQIKAEKERVRTLESKIDLAAKQSSEIITRFITGTQNFVVKKIPNLSADFFNDLPIRALIRGESEQEKEQANEENQEEEVDEGTSLNEENPREETNQVDNLKK